MRLIKHSTKDGDSLIDCFAGSGTFLLMGAKMKRIVSGCDIDTKIAEERGCLVI